MPTQLLVSVHTVTNLAGGASTVITHGLRAGPMGAGDWLEWDFLSTGTNTSLEQFPAAAGVPDIPSVIAGVKLIGV